MEYLVAREQRKSRDFIENHTSTFSLHPIHLAAYAYQKSKSPLLSIGSIFPASQLAAVSCNLVCISRNPFNHTDAELKSSVRLRYP